MVKKHILFFSVAILVVLIDQLFKFIFRRYFEFTKNYGAGFGILRHQTGLLIFIAVLVVGIIFFYYDKIPELTWVNVSVALILGGVVGNLIDRVAFGYVIDFIRPSFWPTTFNVADAASNIGVILLIIYLLKKK